MPGLNLDRDTGYGDWGNVIFLSLSKQMPGGVDYLDYIISGSFEIFWNLSFSVIQPFDVL